MTDLATLDWPSPGKPDSITEAKWKDRWLVDFVVDNRRFWVHRYVEPIFRGFLTELVAPPYPYSLDEGQLDDWSWANRDVRGSSTPSYHRYGCAIDANALKNQQGSRVNDMPPDVRALCARYRLVWGLDWSRPDPMHFQLEDMTPAQAKAFAATLTEADVAWTNDELKLVSKMASQLNEVFLGLRRLRGTDPNSTSEVSIPDLDKRLQAIETKVGA